MANDQPTPKWRNFATWSAVAAIIYILVVWGGTSLLREDGMGTALRSKAAVAMLGLGLVFSMTVVGFSSWKRAFSLRAFRNYVIRSAVAVVICLLVIWAFSAFAGAMGATEWVAAVVGSVLITVASLGILAVASAHTGADLIDDEVAADEMRERGRLLLYSFVWIAAYGLLLIVLGLAGPGGVLSPAAALAGALLLIIVLSVLGIATWRLSDELGRTLSHEASNMAFYLILVLGGGWAMLAHLGFVAGPAPLDWLTLFIVLLFAASFIAAGRRKLFTG